MTYQIFTRDFHRIGNYTFGSSLTVYIPAVLLQKCDKELFISSGSRNLFSNWMFFSEHFPSVDFTQETMAKKVPFLKA